MKRFSILIVFIILASHPSHAQSGNGFVQLRGDELSTAYIGQTLDQVYNKAGLTQTPHHSETHNADGTTHYVEGELTLAGRWALKGPPGLEDKICYRYPQLDAVRQHCFYIFREGKCLYNFPTSWYRNAQAIQPKRWNSKGANREDGPSCDIFVS